MKEIKCKTEMGKKVMRPNYSSKKKKFKGMFLIMVLRIGYLEVTIFYTEKVGKKKIE